MRLPPSTSVMRCFECRRLVRYGRVKHEDARSHDEFFEDDIETFLCKPCCDQLNKQELPLLEVLHDGPATCSYCGLQCVCDAVIDARSKTATNACTNCMTAGARHLWALLDERVVFKSRVAQIVYRVHAAGFRLPAIDRAHVRKLDTAGATIHDLLAFVVEHARWVASTESEWAALAVIWNLVQDGGRAALTRALHWLDRVEADLEALDRQDVLDSMQAAAAVPDLAHDQMYQAPVWQRLDRLADLLEPRSLWSEPVVVPAKLEKIYDF